MRAAVFQGVDQPLSIEEVADPDPLPRMAVVRVGACGICGTDLSITSGRGFLQMPPGFVLGHEYAGEVVAVGPDVERLRVGDHVTSLAIPACGRCPQCLQGDPQWCTGDGKLMGSGAYAEYVRDCRSAGGEGPCRVVVVGRGDHRAGRRRLARREARADSIPTTGCS